jgi:hypothetical protein
MAWLALLALALTRVTTSAWERAVVAIGERLKPDARRLAIALGLAAATVCFAFPIATRAYGDSLVFLKYHGADTLSIYLGDLASLGIRFRGALVLALHEVLARLTHVDLASAYRLTGAACAGVFLFAHARFASGLPASPAIRALVLWLGVVDGANALFFGHVETYAVPRLFACLFLMRMTSALLSPVPARVRAPDLILLGLALVCHMQTAVLVPSLVLWILAAESARWPRLRTLVTPRAVGLALALGCAAIALVYVRIGAPVQNYVYSGGAPTPAQMFLPISLPAESNPALRYSIFSPAHLADVVGSMWTISSAAAIFCCLALIRRQRTDLGVLVLAPAVVLGLAHDGVVNPSIGFPFDWDLMCVASPPLLYLACFLLARTRVSSARLAPLMLVLGLPTLVLFGVNANPAAARHRVQDMALWLHHSYYAGTNYRLEASFEGVDRTIAITEREQVFQRLIRNTWVGDHEVAMQGNNLGLLCHQKGMSQRALAVFRAVVQVEPANEYLKPLGILECAHGDREAGIRLLREYLAAAPTDAVGLTALGHAYQAQHRPDLARACWERSLAVAPDAPGAPAVRQALARLGKS